jgi:tungstate transport system ATP-binding protein
MMLYRAVHLKKVAGGRTILDIGSLAIETGRIYGLLGANGAGKTTLLGILGFLEPPTSGSMEFAGRPVRFKRNVLQQLRREVVMVDQHPVLFSTSVYKNIEFGLKVRKVASKQRERIIDEVLEMVDLSVFKQEPAQELSGGETQRIALARALALSPRVLLCDEPTSSVDVENQAAIVAILNEINSTRNISIIFTTHDRLQAAGLAHHTLVLEGGSLVSASYENIFACLVMDSADNQVLCRLHDSVNLLLPAGERGLEPGKRRILIDPEKIALLQNEPGPETPGILHGKVVQLMADNDRIRMVVNVGVMITVLLENHSYHKLCPVIGDRVWLQVQAGAVN